jgi:hypothetical protein
VLVVALHSATEFVLRAAVHELLLAESLPMSVDVQPLRWAQQPLNYAQFVWELIDRASKGVSSPLSPFLFDFLTRPLYLMTNLVRQWMQPRANIQVYRPI